MLNALCSMCYSMRYTIRRNVVYDLAQIVLSAETLHPVSSVGTPYLVTTDLIECIEPFAHI